MNRLNIKVKTALAASLILASSLQASKPKSCMERASTQGAMNRCALESYRKADAELNRVYKRIKALYKDDKLFLEKLKRAQQTWIKLRDADLLLKFPHKGQPGYYGSDFPMCEAMFKRELTLERIRFLKQWLWGAEEGDLCSGSQKIRPQNNQPEDMP
ncbi:lysozyme inhibitor LprI family protein [Nitratifractor salsuginis]|uniref:Lysozyme inhibitor LprI-like N-terminal domain-containing protein n=1 Tax=Nitratifractor salsuginis (strain DSM 16511 / JCM 12458 / E9I37-1) TaxID=749222 RepID=E6WZ71_NITSE|nr:lysozyme inhibitor LprI family protein [Nitratifractor salsuginis]ADV46583.1 hypothetical protein Nitsa_1332 [Nitratifractor salsuginis DSM 16511]